MSIRLLIADDHEVVRHGLTSLLADTDIEVVGEATNGEEVLERARELKPDLVLLDIRMGESDGLKALEQFRQEQPKLPILVLSMYDNPTYTARAVALGANGYLLKGCSRDELIEAIRIVAAGHDMWTRDELRRVSGALATPRLSGDIEVPLTRREAEVLAMVSQGLTNKEIAKALFISAETVKEHVQRILKKIGVADRTQAAVWAVRKGLV
ncbi:MAG: response regulator transcription factor [Pirellulales bacterium]|nr:response regulator transcription factor [Pirellulales bacterium]